MATPNALERLLGGRSAATTILPPSEQVPVGSGRPLPLPNPLSELVYDPLTRKIKLPARPAGSMRPAITDGAETLVDMTPNESTLRPVVPVTPDESPSFGVTRNKVLDAARAAVIGRIRQQQESGARSYAPADAIAADVAIRQSLAQNKMPLPPTSAKPVSLRRMENGGIIADYSDGSRVVTGRYGTGYTNPQGTSGKGTIEGIPAAQWFQEAANRQNQMVDMGVGKDLYIPEGRKAEFAEGTRRLKAAESAASKAKKA